MPTWLSLHLQTRRTERALSALERLSRTRILGAGSFPGDELEKRLMLGAGQKPPTWLVVAQTQPDWVTVRHGSFAILDGWLESLSRELACTAVQIQGQSVSEAYTLLVAKQGELTRLFQVCHEDDDHEPIEDGEPERFERTHRFAHADFDLEWIAKYVRCLGLDINAGYDRTDWHFLDQSRPAVGAKKPVAKKMLTAKKSSAKSPTKHRKARYE